VIVNGVVRDIPSSRNVVELLAEMGVEPRGVAVALNGEVVRRSQWEVTQIHPSDRVEIVTAVAGG
jgi:sulfur carrier protein